MKEFENICCNRSGICYSRGIYETKLNTSPQRNPDNVGRNENPPNSRFYRAKLVIYASGQYDTRLYWYRMGRLRNEYEW